MDRQFPQRKIVANRAFSASLKRAISYCPLRRSVIDSMNSFDLQIIKWLNGFARQSDDFDSFVWLIATNDLAKAGLILLALGWFWFREDNRTIDSRGRLICTLVGAWISVFIARALSFVVPFRERPLRVPELTFVLPDNADPQAILGWSSFPSDNAALFIALATGIYLLHRGAGLVIYVNILASIAFGRVYEGWHYPTDVLGGAILGIICGLLVQRPAVRQKLASFPLHWSAVHPQSFYAVFLVSVFLTVTSFSALYAIAHILVELSRRLQ